MKSQMNSRSALSFSSIKTSGVARASITALLSCSCLLLLGMQTAGIALAKTEAGAGNEAAGSESQRTESWRKTAPKLPPPRSFSLPKIEKFSLPNGLKVELVEDHKVPFSTFVLGIRAGIASDPGDKAGLSAMVARMLSEGTQKLSSKEIAEEIDSIGGGLSANASQDFTLISASALSKYNERLLNALADIVQNPSFPESELKLKKENTIQELKIRRSKPDFLANERFAKELFGDHPYSVIAPKPETIEKLSRQDLVDFHKRCYLPNASDMVIVGDFKIDEMKALLTKSFSGWQKGASPEQKFSALPKSEKRRILLVNRPDSVQSRIKIGNVGIKRSDPDYFALTVANQILGGAATSRLFMNIRENKGYTYGAYSSFLAQQERGPLSAEAEVRTDVTSPAVQEFLYELDKMRNLKPSEKELAGAKNYLVGSFQLGLETQAGLAGRLIEGQLYGLPADYLERFAEKVMAVSSDDVRAAARKHIDFDNLLITVVGAADKIKGDLEFFAPVAVYDSAGTLVAEPGSTKPAASTNKSAGGL